MLITEAKLHELIATEGSSRRRAVALRTRGECMMARELLLCETP